MTVVLLRIARDQGPQDIPSYSPVTIEIKNTTKEEAAWARLAAALSTSLFLKRLEQSMWPRDARPAQCCALVLVRANESRAWVDCKRKVLVGR